MKKNVYLFQPQYAINVGGEDTFWLPYSAACIWSYVYQFKKIKDYYQLGNIFFRRSNHQEILDSLKEPFIVGFSCYNWNQEYCLILAEEIKKRWPNCTIIFGGPQASGRFFKHNFIDSIVMGEGEESFLEILSLLKNSKPIQTIYKKARLNDLDIPSPYLDGTLDLITDKKPNITWAATIETNRGCPYACTFCDWGGVTYSKIKKFNLERIQAELNWISKHKIGYLFGADANFGIFKERDLEIAKLMREAADKGSLEAINLQYAKNNTGSVFEIGKIIGPYNRGITVSVQSMNPDTLEAIKRKNLDVNDIKTVMDLSEEHGVRTYTEVILGLPLETEETWRNGLSELLELGQHHNIDFAIAEMLENSELNSAESRQKYQLKTIKVENYYSLKQDPYPESTEIVCATSTMTTDEMVRCYMYTWMIMHIHVNGYSQIYSKYLNKVKGVPYRKFYDELFTEISEYEIFSQHYKELQDTIYHYLTTGKLKTDVQKGDAFHFVSHRFCFDNRNLLFDLGKKVFQKFEKDSTEIEELQRYMIFDDKIDSPKPIEIETNLNLATWKKEKSRYLVTNSMYDLDKESYQASTIKDKKYKKIDFWVMRRRNLLKNYFIKL